jgi:hypothetical protein
VPRRNRERAVSAVGEREMRKKMRREGDEAKGREGSGGVEEDELYSGVREEAKKKKLEREEKYRMSALKVC